MEIIDKIFEYAWYCVPGMCIYICTHLFFKSTSDKTKYFSRFDQWIDINQTPLPDDIQHFIATEGKKVNYVYMPRYNRYGKAIFGYDDKEITHWTPYPEPPKFL